MPDSLLHFNEYLDVAFQHGTFWVYVVIFVACFIENLFPPFPGDTFIVAAGGLVALSRLNPVVSMIAVIGGGMCSVMLIYTIGRRYGRDYFMRKNFRYFSAADVVKMEVRLAKWGPLILICSRFVVGARSAIALAAGVGRYSNVKTFIYSGISYLIFAGVLMYVSSNLVRNLDAIHHYFMLYDKIILPIIGGLLIVWLVYKYRTLRNRA